MRNMRATVLLGLTAVLGCGGGPADNVPVAAVKGKVTLDGAPVTGGSITFSPVSKSATSGKSAIGSIQSDGTFTLTTYKPNDGAAVGTCTVFFAPPAPEVQVNADGHSVQLPGKFDGLKAKTAEVEVKAGGPNEITIELTK